MSELNLDNLYRLPWTNNDNPNGWIEVTTYCQLKCPGCYRGLAEDDPERKHENFEKIKREIDLLLEKRNIQTLSIAGGEPLLYPSLKEVIIYANKLGLKTKIYTNGCALTKKKLIDLKEAGATEFIIHIDEYQKRPDTNSSFNINDLRIKFCNLFREVGGVNLGFIMPIGNKDYKRLHKVINFYIENSDIINLVVFTTYKDILPVEDNTFRKNNIRVSSMFKLSDFLSKSYNILPCAFLGKINNKDIPSWLFMVPVFYNGKVLGYLDHKTYEYFQRRYKNKKGKYFITIKGNDISPSSLIPFIFRKSILKIFYNLLKEKTKLNKKSNLKYQVVLIIDGPDKINNIWNLCDGCPDAMLYEGRLVPSCLLERIKIGEKIAI